MIKKDNINTRSCYIVTGVETNKVDNVVNIKEIEFMDLKVDDIFILYEEDGTVVTWKDGKVITAKATAKPYYKTVNGQKIKTVNTDLYDFSFTEFKIVMEND